MTEIKKISICLIFSAVLIFSGCNKGSSSTEEKPKDEARTEEVKLNEKQIKEIGLETEKVTFKPFTGYLKVPAKVITNQDQEAQVGSLVQGRVKRVFVKVGDFVKAGQELMDVEGLEIGEIKAAYITAKSSLNFQKANYDRQKVLSEQKVGSQKALLEAQSEYEKARAEFDAADKKIHSIGLNDNEVTDSKGSHSEEHTSGTLPVKAPISGVVIERNVVIGQLIDGTTNAFRIVNTSSVWIDGQLSEKDVNKVNSSPAVVFASSSQPDKEFNGKVSYVGQVIDEKSRTVTLRAEFSNKNNLLKAQMFGELTVPVSQNSKSILIPSEAVVRFDNQEYVFIQKDASTFQRRAVKTGSQAGDLVEIREGLKEGEIVVTKGSFYLKSEMMKSEFGEEE
ncbi:MAG TPA: efflux RND transporter periplasmic adaptor subunit [Ignavibacteriales bacterium]|nr:efflux RND transporter periplasmic adaptor subunit [Ignavibacteriales bacterium]